MPIISTTPRSITDSVVYSAVQSGLVSELSTEVLQRYYTLLTDKEVNFGVLSIYLHLARKNLVDQTHNMVKLMLGPLRNFE